MRWCSRRCSASLTFETVHLCTCRLRGEKRSLENQERMGHRTQGGVMVKASPQSTLEVVEPDLALHLFVVSLHAPAQLAQPHQ